jgi:hypothetical protein
VGVVSAFIISNASFYVLAGYFQQMSLLQYTNAVAAYLPQFVESTALYVIAAGVVAYAWMHIRALISSRFANR